MKISVNLNGQKRKVLAEAISNVLCAELRYKGPPTFAFEVGPAIVERDATITLSDDSIPKEDIGNLLSALIEAGFSPYMDEMPDNSHVESAQEVSAEDTPAQNNPTLSTVESPTGITIQMPRADFSESSLENLRLLVQSKASLIKKALGVDALPIVTSEETVDFPWFPSELPPPELNAYTNLIAAMCDMAKRQSRIMGVEKPTDNEKFTFRLFLVRLGLKGDEYADTRRILLRNLTGNGSWKDGAPKQPTKRQNTSPEAPPAATCSAEADAHGGAPPKQRFSWRNWFKSIRIMGY